jgi:glycosyltransferase involved in cell wall biosynthesis
LKIVYLSPVGEIGGAEKVLWGVMTGVRRLHPEAQLHLLALAPGPLVDRAREAGFAVTVEPLPAALASLGDSRLRADGSPIRTVWSMAAQALTGSGSALGYLQRVRDVLRAIRPDLIHSNGIKAHCLAWLTASRKTPIIWHVHDFFSARPMARRLLRLASRGVRRAIAVSQAVADDLQSMGLTIPTQVVPNAVDVDEFHPGPADGAMLDRLAGLDPAESVVRIGLIATYARWKGQDVFLEAAAKVMQADSAAAVRFYIVGGPIYQTRGSQFARAELVDLARRLGIERNVGFIDFQHEVAPIYRALDVVVHASKAPEPFGLTIIEAMACGKPVVATLAGGVVEIIKPGHDGLGVPPGDATALAGALQSLIADAQLRDRLGATARETVCRRFDQERLAAQVFNVYRPLLHWPGGVLNQSLAPNILELHSSFTPGD